MDTSIFQVTKTNCLALPVFFRHNFHPELLNVTYMSSDGGQYWRTRLHSGRDGSSVFVLGSRWSYQKFRISTCRNF